MSSPREQVLASIRAALADTPDGYSPPPVNPPPAPPAGERLLELFIQRAAGTGATITTCNTDGIAATLRDVCARHSARRLAAPIGLPERWHPDGVQLIPDELLNAAALDQLDGVITGAAVAIAESGTIALDGSPDQGRRALTLIPDLHLCVVQATRIVPALPQALELLAPSITPGRRALLLISGPSATADIELTRVQGVHGPRRLEIVIATNTNPNP
ncbi:MAG: lactate utilization protein C, partial [Solirubrobacteraceae bacterium]|jgi:L-lactate dehydrogenase complex protein LldG